MVNFLNLIDLRWLLVFSPITSAIAWAMFVHEEPSFQDFWWF